MWPETQPTEVLLKAVKQGEDGAEDQLFTRHRQAVEKLIELRLDHKVRQREAVSDILQEVFIEASRRLRTYLQDPKLDFHLWLRQIAKDRVIDAYRRHRKSEKRNLDRQQSLNLSGETSVMMVRQFVDPGVTPAAALAQKEMEQLVSNAVESLPELDREIIVMRHYEQLTNQEVAKVLNLTAPAASMRYLRAVEKLKALLSPGS